MTEQIEKAIALARHLQTTHMTSDPHAADVIDDLADGVLAMAEQARPQHDPGARVYMREAIELLRKIRGPLRFELNDIRRGRCDEQTIVAHNLRDAYEWLWPLLWTDDPEFVPFKERPAL